MPDLISIGAFARLGGVSIKALRLYERHGLLKPAVTSAARYRLYARSQLASLHRILLLKGMGLRLSQLPGVLARLDEEALRTIRAALAARVDDMRKQIAWVERELASRAESRMELSGVVVKRLPRVRVRSRSVRLDRYDEVDPLLSDLRRELPAAASLIPGAIWHDCGRRTHRIDCEAFWALNGPLRAATTELAPATVASVLSEDDAASGGYDVLHRWVREQGTTLAGPIRELYLGPGGGEGAGLTEIQFPIPDVRR